VPLKLLVFPMLSFIACGGGTVSTPDEDAPASSANPSSKPASTGDAAGEVADAADSAEVVATVGGLPISSSEFQQAAARRQTGEGAEGSESKTDVLDRLVAEKLLYLKAIELGLERDPKVQKVMINTLLRDKVYSTVRNSDFPETELQTYYQDHKDEFVIPEKVQVKRILIRVTPERTEAEARSETERIRTEITADSARFRELASEYSEGPYKRRGGDIGFVAREGKPGLDPTIVEKAFSLEVDAISDVFETREGFNVITVAKRRERVERSFQQVKGAVLRKLKNEKLKDLYDTYVDGLKQGADVAVNSDVLDGLSMAPTLRSANPLIQARQGMVPLEPSAPGTPKLQIKGGKPAPDRK
jgi:parvulin-like peptidyl-prolyl isomerase